MRAKLFKGFTLVEAVVIILIVGLLAAAIVPNLAAFTRSRRESAFESELQTLAGAAQQKAISLGTPVDMTYDAGNTQVQLHTTDANGSDQVIKTLNLPADVQPGRFVAGTTDSDPTSWRLTFYPNGTSEGGGIQLQAQNQPVSLFVDAESGHAILIQGTLPDTTTFSWPAGDYIHRAAS